MKFDIEKINNLEDLKKIKYEFNNSKELLDLISSLKTAPSNEKAEIGKKIQTLKKEAEDFFEQAKNRIEEIENNKIIESEYIDYATP
ncbi:aminoacyl tRNA synthetase class II, N-terminal domain protein, partial [Chlamydia psittaci 02DC14]